MIIIIYNNDKLRNVNLIRTVIMNFTMYITVTTAQVTTSSTVQSPVVQSTAVLLQSTNVSPAATGSVAPPLQNVICGVPQGL